LELGRFFRFSETLKSARSFGLEANRKGSRRRGWTIKAHERSFAEVWSEAGRSSSKGGNNQERSDPPKA
jgi:hypothetical protein